MKDPDIAGNLERTTELVAEMRAEGRRHAEMTAGNRDVQRELILDMRDFREDMREFREDMREFRDEWREGVRADRERARKEAQLHHAALQQTNESMALMLDELRGWGDRRK